MCSGVHDERTWTAALPLVAGTLAVAASQVPYTKRRDTADAQASTNVTTAGLLAISAVSEHLKKHTLGMYGLQTCILGGTPKLEPRK